MERSGAERRLRRDRGHGTGRHRPSGRWSRQPGLLPAPASSRPRPRRQGAAEGRCSAPRRPTGRPAPCRSDAGRKRFCPGLPLSVVSWQRRNFRPCPGAIPLPQRLPRGRRGAAVPPSALRGPAPLGRQSGSSTSATRSPAAFILPPSFRCASPEQPYRPLRVSGCSCSERASERALQKRPRALAVVTVLVDA